MATADAVGERIRHLREQRGWTPSELARQAKMHRSHIQRIEDGSFGFPRPATLEKLARALNVQVDEITGREQIRQVTPYDRVPEYRLLIDTLESVEPSDRNEIVRHALWTAERATRLPLNIVAFPGKQANDEGDFPPLPEGLEIIEKDTDTPRPLHAWIVPVDAEAAAGLPRQQDDWLIPTTQLLNTVREVRDDRTKVVKIFGDSMYPTLRDGWKVLLDPARSLFAPGRIVVVYIQEEGLTIGVLARQGDRYWIQKRNESYGGPMQIPLKDGAWYPVGTLTKIVEAPIEIE